MTKLAARIGVWAAILNTICALVYLAGVVILITTLLSGQTPAELAASNRWTNIQDYAAHYADNPLTMNVGLGVQASAFVSGIAILVIFLALHEVTDPPKKIITRIASAFALILAITSSWGYYIQFASVHQTIMAGGDLEGLGQFAESNVASPAMATLQLGWAFFYGLATLVAIPAFGGSRVEKWIKGAFAVNGVIAVFIGVVYAFGVTSLLPLAVLGLVATSFAYPLLAVFFHRVERGGLGGASV